MGLPFTTTPLSTHQRSRVGTEAADAVAEGRSWSVPAAIAYALGPDVAALADRPPAASFADSIQFFTSRG